MPMEQKRDERVIKVNIIITGGDLSLYAEGTMDEMETIRVLQFGIDTMQNQITQNARIQQATRLVIPGFEPKIN